MRLDRVAVIGGGAWGTALAQAAALAGRQVTLVARDPAVVDEINTSATNRKHLGACPLHPSLKAAEALPDADFIILAVPAQQSRAALTEHLARLTLDQVASDRARRMLLADDNADAALLRHGIDRGVRRAVAPAHVQHEVRAATQGAQTKNG